jgi:flagellar hook-basal body protein
MSFYTSLTGLNAATSQLSVTSNNIANVGTTGFKRSRADFGDIFATSPLQKASSVVGQGTALKQVSQEFSQGNIQFSANSLDIAITGDGFFPLKSADGLQDIYTRNGTFLLNDSYAVVNGSGQALIAASVDSSGKADLDNLSKLIIPRSTTGDAVATTNIQLGLNLPADAKIPTLPFDKNDPTTYNKTTAITVYDAGGNDYLATVYYRKTQVAKPEDPSNKWQTFVYIGDTKLQELLIQSKDKAGEAQFVNKYGEVRSESDIPPQDIARGVTKLFNLDDLKNPIASTPATAKSASPLPVPLVNEWKNGIDFPSRISTWLDTDTNSVKGAVFSDIGAQGYNLNTRSTVAADESGIAITGLIFEPEELGNKFEFFDGTNTYSGDDLDELAANIEAGGDFTVDHLAGTLTILLRDDSNLQEIDSLNALTVIPTGETAGTELEPIDTIDKITELTFEVDAATDGSGMDSLMLVLGNSTYTGADVQSLRDKINSAGEYTATLDAVANPNTLTISLTGVSGDPEQIDDSYKLTHITASLEAATLTELANDINLNGDLKYEASVNANGQLIIKPKDSADPFEIPEFSMIASFPNDFEIPSETKTNSAVSFTVDYLSENFSLDLGAFNYLGVTVEDLVDDVNDGGLYTATLDGNSDGSSTISINKITNGALIPTATSLTASSIGVKTGADDIVFDLIVDESATPVTIDLSYLKDLASTKKFTGVEIAREITSVINKAYGDERYFDFTAFKSANTSTKADMFRLTVGDKESNISLTEGQFGIVDLSAVKLKDAISALQAVIDKEVEFTSPITVGYDPVRQTFTFKPEDDVDVSIRSYNTARNDLFGLTEIPTTLDPDTGAWGRSVLPNGGLVMSSEDQRYGVEVKFDEVTGEFAISSGTTGDTSSISISKSSALARVLFGFVQGDTATEVNTSPTPLRGITSAPAELKGNAIGINLDNKFRVDGSNNQFVVTVDNVTGLITMPEKADYTMEEFRQALEDRVNALADNFGRTVNGVKLDIVTNPSTNTKSFVFKTGTTGDDSFLKVSANSIWGLDGLPSARGTTSRWIEPPQAQNADGFPLYVDRDGLETSDPGTFSEDETRDLWSPIFLDKGELTFDTAGNLRSPLEAIAFKSTTIGDSGATLQFAIDYVSSTQYSSPFSVLKQDQNGRPEGDLIGVDIGDDGLVSASYSNGSQKSLAKIVLVNFASPTGLRQIGDASYYATSKSGDAKYGEAGSAGFGTVRAGARERANVDLTNELIELITAQRNFQANAKAIETNNTLTQAIINIRS